MMSSYGLVQLLGVRYSRNRYLDRLTRESLDSSTFATRALAVGDLPAEEWELSESEEIASMPIHSNTAYSRSQVSN